MLKNFEKNHIKLRLIITGIGILIILLNNLGVFIVTEKSKFAELVVSSVEAIPRNTPGFEEFLKDFPPPDSISSSSIIQISDKHYTWSRDPNVINTISYDYDKDSHRTNPIARFDEVRKWSENHIYNWLGFSIVLFGFLLDLISSFLSKKKKREA